MNTKKQLLFESLIDPYEHGTIVDMANFTAGGQSVLCYCTTRGKLCGLDLRSNNTVWDLSNNAKFGGLRQHRVVLRSLGVVDKCRETHTSNSMWEGEGERRKDEGREGREREIRGEGDKVRV